MSRAWTSGSRFGAVSIRGMHLALPRPMGFLRIDGPIGAALAGVFLVACFLGCESRALEGPPVGQNGESGGTSREPGDAGTMGGPGGGGTSGAGGSSDPCAISCGQAACPVRAGEPRVLVTSDKDHQIMGLAANADTLFWGTYPNQTQGELRSMPLAGGPSTLLASNVVITELFLDGSTLYYVDRNNGYSLIAIPATGGTSRVVAAGSTIGWITAYGASIYFAQGNGIMRVDRTASNKAPESVVVAAGTLWGFAVDDTNVYWAAYSTGGSLNRRSLAGGDTTKLRTSSAPITFPIIDGDDIDYMEGINTPATCMSAIWAIAKSGAGAPRLISPGTSGIDVRVPVRDGTTLYWSSDSPHGAVLKMVKGQTPEILAASQINVTAPVLGPSDIYWIATDSRVLTGPDWLYEVRTLPK